MKPIYLITSNNISDTLKDMISATLSGREYIKITSSNNMPSLKNSKVIFACEIDYSGYNIELYKIFNYLFSLGDDSLENSDGIVLVHSKNEIYTKSMAQDIVFKANRLGCEFMGRPIVEATGPLRNFLTMQKVINKPLYEVCMDCCEELGERFFNHLPTQVNSPKILVLHSSNHQTSNTLRLWNMVSKHLTDLDIVEINVENGKVLDCIGCPYKMCKHYGEKNSCFYGGIMVEEVYPAIIEADALIWICPNYNDAISANLTAVINRLTALFRKTKFYDKSIFGVIVSGNSGGDVLSKQLISALNMNKTFRLPPHFSLMATANDKDAILSVDDIENKALIFANNIKNSIKK